MICYPKNVGIIMDGNRRWAKINGTSQHYGHKIGATVVKDVIEKCMEYEIKQLSIFAFSTENWKRKLTEVNSIIKLIEIFIRSEIAEMNKKNIVFRVIGNIQRFNQRFQDLLLNAQELTKSNSGLVFNAALNYGGAMDMTHSAKVIADKVLKSEIDISDIDENIFRKNLLSEKVDDIDLLIRTSGEQRLSNFLLWQCRYSEIYFCKCLWPDFTSYELERSFVSFSQRDRRYGSSSKTQILVK